MASRVADELVSPLTNLSARLEVMIAEAGERGEHCALADDLPTLHGHAQRLNHLLEVLRCYAADGAARLRPIPLNEIVSRAHASLGATGVTLALDPQHPLIFGDAGPLESFVARVLAEARRASGDGRGIRVETGPADGEPHRVVVVVSGMEDMPALDQSASPLLAAHSATLDVRTIDGRAALVVTFPRSTLLVPALAPADAPAQAMADLAGAGNERTEAVQETARALRESFDVSELAQRVSEAVLPLFGARSSTAWLRRPDGYLACAGVAGPDPDGPKLGDVLPPGTDLVGRTVTDGRALRTVDAFSVLRSAHGAGPGHVPSRADGLVVLAVPLVVRSTVIGALVTRYARPGDLGEEDVDLVQAFADHIAPAMRDVQRFECEQAARTDAEAANRAKDDFLAMLGHELRTPIAAIAAAGSVLDRLPHQDERGARACSVISRQTGHVCRIVDDLLDVRRLSMGKLRLRRHPLDLCLLVQHCIETLEVAGRTGHHRLVCKMDPVWIDADETRMEQLVNNLVVNALKYTAAGGTVIVRVRPDEDEAVLDVEDTGIGIAARDLACIFDLFFQADGGSHDVRGGLGIGLTLVKRIVELHGGRISAASAGINRGSSFSVRLPRALPPGASSEDARLDPPASLASDADGRAR